MLGTVGFGDARSSVCYGDRIGRLVLKRLLQFSCASLTCSNSRVFSMRSLTMYWPFGTELSETTSSRVRGPSPPSDS